MCTPTECCCSSALFCCTFCVVYPITKNLCGKRCEDMTPYEPNEPCYCLSNKLPPCSPSFWEAYVEAPMRTLFWAQRQVSGPQKYHPQR